ncbi:MAG: precorrin-6A reductase [Planctomycetota bacterium]|jgi:precorrin-6x reductase|nr:precorrin-6A reductase [Planctomycetota bacterium]
MRVVLFAGTREGREISQHLASLGANALISVATPEGQAALGEIPLPVRVGRLDQAGILELLDSFQPDLVVDATHPYAVQASLNIAAAAREAGLEVIRPGRAETPPGEANLVDTLEEAAAAVGERGNVLLAIGSQGLGAFRSCRDFPQRFYPRLLPTASALTAAQELGFPFANIVAMQGPFSQALNHALMRQLAIQELVTKDGGEEGGTPAKLAAARELGVRAILIRRPPGSGGITLAEVKNRLAKTGEEKLWK